MKNEAEQKLLDAVEESVGRLMQHALGRLPDSTQEMLNRWLDSGICRLVAMIETDPFAVGIALVRKDGRGKPIGLINIIDNGEEQTKVEVGH